MQAFLSNSGLSGLYNLIGDKKIGIASILYIIVCLLILNHYGININGEAPKYITDANRIINGDNLREGFFSIFYLTYSLLVSVFIYFSIGLNGIAFLQILLSLTAAFCIYKLLFNITNDANISYATFIIFLVSITIQKWIFFLYTESLHTSLVVIALYYFYCIIQNNQTKRWWIFLLLLFLIIFSRPVSVIFLLSAFCIWLIKLGRAKRLNAFYIFGMLLIIFVVILFQSNFVFYFNPDSLRRMEIICGVSRIRTGMNYKEYNAEGLSSFFNVLFSEIGIKSFLINGIKKLFSFFGLVRSFYSTGHNIFLLGTQVVLYPFAIAGLFFQTNKKSFYIKTFSIIYILITSIGIFFTCDEWSNRFIAPVFPFIIILSGLGLYFLKARIKPV